MLQSLRTRARALAAATLMVLAAAASASVLHVTEACHDECAPAFVVHDASAHRITGIDTSSRPEPLHCLVCHWARTLRPRIEAAFNAAPAAPAQARVYVQVFRATPSVFAAQPPLRSPPVLDSI